MGISAAVTPSAVASVVGVKTLFKNLQGSGNITYLPQQIAVLGQGNTASTFALTKAQYTSALAVAEVYGFGSPLHLAAMQLFPINGDGVGTIPVTFFPLADGDTEAAGDITPTAGQAVAAAYQVSINNILSEAFVVSVGDLVPAIITAMTAAINANLNMPVLAVDATPGTSTKCDLTAKWKGLSGNDLVVSITSVTDGATFAITQPVGGLVNPTVDQALAQFGDVWYTLALNCLNVSDLTALATLETFGVGRWGAIVKKPLVFFTGNTATTVAAAIVETDALPTYFNNAQLVLPGSSDLPFVVAARMLARIAVRADSNPPHDYILLKADGLTPGADGDQWNYLQRDQAVKAGSSTVEIRDGAVYMGDTITFYHPAGDPLPAYRYVVDIIKLQNIIFNLDLLFNNADWRGAPLLPDADPTVNRAAKKPYMFRASVATMLDSLGKEAIISDPATAKDNTLVEIDSQNPKRVNMVVPVQLSGNNNITSIDLEFGYYFGTPEIVG